VFSKLEGEFSDGDKEHFKSLRTAGRRLILLDGLSLESDADEILQVRFDSYQMAGGELGRLSAATTHRIIGHPPNPFEPPPPAAAAPATN
jgi:hypothetical protein